MHTCKLLHACHAYRVWQWMGITLAQACSDLPSVISERTFVTDKVVS
jgi:hypothetical protein